MMIRARWILFAGLAGMLCAPNSSFALGDPDAAAPGFGFGPRAAYYKGADAEKGVWTGGLQARLRLLPMLGAEGSVDYREDDYAGGAVEVRSYPVMVSALLYIWPTPAVSPYLLGGAGWHYTDVKYKGALAGRPNDKTSEFGYQAGGGVDIPLGDAMTLDADIRYIFLDFDEEVRRQAASDISADSLAVTVGLTFYFR